MIYCKVQTEWITSNGECTVNEFEYKYGLDAQVYYIYKSFFGKYKIKSSRICAFVCTNRISYQLYDGSCELEESLYDNIDDAINECERRNKRKRYGVK